MHLTNDSQIAELFQFRNENIRTQLQHWVETQPEKVFINWHPFVGEPGSWTYRRFWDDVCAVAAGLQVRGVKQSDKVILHLDNCPEMLLAWYACAMIGAVAVTTNTGATPSEMKHFIQTTEPVAAITQPSYKALLMGFKDQLGWMAITDNNSGEAADEDPSDELFAPFADLSATGQTVAFADCSALTPTGILFTSGTTGKAKAVVHTHGNFLWAARSGAVNTNFLADDVFLAYLPLFHVNSQMWATAIALGRGGSIVLLPKVTVSRFWPIVQKYGVTHMTMLPLLLPKATATVPEKHSMKYVGMAEVNELSKTWGCRFHSIYGSSETVTHAIATDVHRQWPERAFGRTVPGYQVQVINPETGDISRSGETGEVWVKGTRGIQMFLEYYNDAAATDSAFVDGWYRTGDLVRLGDNGEMYFAQRLKDMIKVGGENVGVDEVEAMILQVPEVKEVAVVAKKDPALDEIPVAFVIPAEGASTDGLEEKILAHCREHLSAFKLPRFVRIVDDFPRALLDKVAKNVLRDMANKL